MLAARPRPLTLSQVRVTDPFWLSKLHLLREVTLPIQYERCEQTGRIENFRRAASRAEGGFQGRYYNDSDVYKWVEAACFLESAIGLDEPTLARLGDVVGLIERAQLPDGYLNTYFQLEHPELRWRNLSAMHEMYCSGHLLEAAVAHSKAFGSERLLGVAVRFADHLWERFGPDGRPGFCGHEEIELALLKLAACVPERSGRYRELAALMVRRRGLRPSPFEAELADEQAMSISPWMRSHLFEGGAYSGRYLQDDLPLCEQREPVGHAVRAMYLYTAATELFFGRDTAMTEALEAIWERLTERRMYVTGGIGSSERNEGFTRDYDLPNANAYAETCAECGLVFWSRALAVASKDAQYADVMELALYNGALAGMSGSGAEFFYANPLASDGEHSRSEWYDCACCPPNLARLIASVGEYVAFYGEGALNILLPIAAELNLEVNGVRVAVTIRSSYSSPGGQTSEVELEVSVERPVEFELRLRMPGWCDTADVELAEPPAEYDRGFIVWRRAWKGREVMRVSFDLNPRWLSSAQEIEENRGRVAAACGPLIYCLEEADLGEAVEGFGVDASRKPEPIGEGLRVHGWLDGQPNIALLRPYYAWGNRGPGGMRVWLPDGPSSNGK